MTKKRKKQSTAKADPFAVREASKYSHPIPSREYILEHLKEVGCPTSLNQLYTALGLEIEPEQSALLYRLKAMVRDGQIMRDRRGRYCLLNKLTLVPGRVVGHPDGYGFVIPDDRSEDLHLSPREMRKVLHGDRVLARQMNRGYRGRIEGAIHEVIEHVNTQLVGRFHEENGVAFVVPDNKRITQSVYIPPQYHAGAKVGQIVMIEVLTQPTQGQLTGRILEVLGEHMAPGMEIDIAIRSHNLLHEWPEQVTLEADTLPKRVTAEDISARADMRDFSFVTIDGEDAKDFDDAVFCEARPRGGWRLCVAIADVSYYVKPNTALEEEALARGNSVYFPGRVIPMLPEQLSNELCSLRPQVDRLCLVCDMTLSATGKMTQYHFYRASIHSKARLTYTQVAAALAEGDEKARQKLGALLPNLEQLYVLYKILHQARKNRGALDFDTTETRILFDKKKKIKKIVPVTRNDAHRLIEECMLLANVAASRFLQKHKIMALYRVHDVPSDDRLTDLRAFLGELGLSLPGGKKTKPRDFADVLDSIQGRPDAHLIQTVMLRSLKQAHYQEENIGHFGLAYDAYTHFTSPIRRYPDLLVHRAICHILESKPANEFMYSQQDLNRMGVHCSETERRADDATRDVVSWLKCEYMQDKLGQEFDGIISGVTSFGIFVELKEIYVEGLVHVTSLKNDYYQFDAVKHRLMGERSGVNYRLGDPIRVLVARVDLDDRKIDFDLAERK